MSRARDNANLGAQAGSGLDASDITTGVLPVGVTGGSGLTALGTVASGTIGGSSVINTSGAITTTGAFTSVGIDDNASGAVAITIDANENVGIGVTPDMLRTTDTALALGATARQFVTSSNHYVDMNNVKLDASGNPLHITTNPATRHQQLNTGVHTFDVAPSASAGAAVSFSSAMTIDNSGNVGIGVDPENAVSSTFTQLQVGGNGNLNVYGAQGASGEMDFGHNFYKHISNSHKRMSNDEATMYRQGSGKHTFYTAGAADPANDITWTTGMVIDGSANVGIGTASPSAILDVKLDSGVTRTGSTIVEVQSGHGSASDYTLFNVKNTEIANALIVRGDGKVGIGESTPDGVLHIKKASGNHHLVISAEDDSASRAWALSTAKGNLGHGFLGIYPGTTQTGAPGNAPVMSFDPSGDVKVNTGDLVFGTAGKGVVLGATTNVAANTLDDYEEGYTTFSSGYTNGGGGTQNFYSGNTAYHTMSYTKIGRLVTVQAMFIMGGYSGTDGDLRIGLPFTIGGDHGGISSRGVSYLHNTSGGVNTKNYSVGGRSSGDAYMVVHQSNSGPDGGSLAPSSSMGGNGTRISFSYTYITDQ